MLFQKCQDCQKILTEAEVQQHERKLLLNNKKDGTIKCFSCQSSTKNLLKG